MKKNLRRIYLQSGCTDRMQRTIDGIFELLLDEDVVVEQMERAYKNTGNESRNGALIIRYQAATKAQADYYVKLERKTISGPLVDQEHAVQRDGSSGSTPAVPGTVPCSVPGKSEGFALSSPEIGRNRKESEGTAND